MGDKFKGQEMSIMLWALATLQHPLQPPQLLADFSQEWTRRLLDPARRSDSGRTQHLANLAWSLARLRVRETTPHTCSAELATKGLCYVSHILCHSTDVYTSIRTIVSDVGPTHDCRGYFLGSRAVHEVMANMHLMLQILVTVRQS